MALTQYKSTDGSAPSVTGTVGSLVALLDAILVNGYGAKAAAGWGKEYSGTNKAVYRAAAGNRHRLRVDDTAAQDARLVGYLTMSDVDTGTGPFPTTVQLSGGGYMRKSSTADATARPWWALADSRYFYLQIYAGQTVYGNSSSADSGIFFGEIDSYLPGDAYHTLLIGGTASTTTRLGAGGAYSGGGDNNFPGGHFLALPYTQAGSAAQAFKAARWPMGGNAGTGAFGDTSFDTTYPDPISGGLLLSRVDVYETTSSGFSSRRGVMPSMHACLHNLPAAHDDTFAGTGALSGKNFVLKNVWNAGGQGRCAFEVP